VKIVSLSNLGLGDLRAVADDVVRMILPLLALFGGGEAPVEDLSEGGLVGWVTGISRRPPYMEVPMLPLPP
jgi:hypothetical protein